MKCSLALLLAAAPVPLIPQSLPAQAMPGMAMPAPPAPTMPGMSGMADMHGAHAMRGMLGPYPMTRDASGTAWQPDSSPMTGVMDTVGDWSVMGHGYATLVGDRQGGPRGADKAFVESMLMGMAQRAAAGGTVTVKAMVSLDPLMGARGYPLLLATGETADGRTELVDRQHPHDAFMELSATYARPLARGVSGFVYVGLPGEPALGPATFMHRYAGLANPEAPIAHHWLDSTHITFGVATVGVTTAGVKLEASAFKGREPDQHRWDIERPRFDSWSVRATWNPGPDWSLQLSHGDLHSPEQLRPEESLARTTASATYNRRTARGVWQTTLAWGRNAPRGGAGRHATTDAVLVESALTAGRWTVFGRGERVGKDELFAESDPRGGRVWQVAKLSLGGYRTWPLTRDVGLDLGGLVSRYALPAAIRGAYGDPTSGMVFARLRLGG